MEKPGFKSKTIKSIIRRKIDKWLESITDEALRARVAQGTIVTGGCIVSMLMGEEVNDFDIYLRDHDTLHALAEYYVELFRPKCTREINVLDEEGRVRIVVKSDGFVKDKDTKDPEDEVITDTADIEDAYQETEKKALETKDEAKPKHLPVFLTTNAITLKGKIQIIVRFWGEPDKIHENYDFVHCTSYWTSWDNELVLRPAALEAILSRELRYVGSKYPVCSLVRVRKFVQRGWRINAGQLVKMAMQISKLDLEDFKVLEDQLTGVDTAYFMQLIEAVREKDPARVDSAYLLEIVDRIF